MRTPRFSKCSTAGAFVLAAAMGLTAATVVPAQSAVVAAPTATTTTVGVQAPTLAYGDTTKVTVSVDAVSNGPKPAGKVELKLGDKTLVADVANSGKVDFDLPLLNAATTPYAATATFIPADAAAFGASTSVPVNVTVAKDATTTTVTARHNKVKRKIVVKSSTTSAHGQVPTGKVQIVLRRNGRKVALLVATPASTGAFKIPFRNVRGKGTYKVISKYLGSSNFVASKGTFRIAP